MSTVSRGFKGRRRPSVRALKAQQGLTRGDLAKGAAYTVAFAVFAVAGPNIVGHDKNSPHAFTKAQMGHHDVEAT